MQWLHLLVLAFFMASALGQEDQTIIQTSETEENSSKQLPSPKVTESDSSPARQRPQQGPGWGGLISGKVEFLFSLKKYDSPKITKKADLIQFLLRNINKFIF